MHEIIKQLVKNKFFKATFVKSNGETRKMLARLGVKKHLKGGELKYNPKDYDNMVVYDMQKKGYRTINLKTLKQIKVNGKEYNFNY